MTCSECKHFFTEGTAPAGTVDLGTVRPVNSFCRRYPPQLLLAPGPTGPVPMSLFPTVNPAACCGEFATDQGTP